MTTAYLCGVWIAVWCAIAAAARTIIGRIPKIPEGTWAGTDPETVSVVIPARNEAYAIARTVESLLSQSYANIEIIVVNDGSNDATGAILDDLSQRTQQITVIHDPPLAAGWLGKPNALAAGVKSARGPWLLFADADIEFEPRAVECAVAEARAASLDGLSLLPRLITGSWAEAALLPVFPAAILALRPDRSNDERLSGGFAAGAFILLKRTTYDCVGGHGAVRAEVIDDIALGRLVKAGGHPFRVYRGESLTSVRMYTGVRSLFYGMVKNLSFVAGGKSGNPYIAPLSTLAASLAFGFPLASLALTLGTGGSPLVPAAAYAFPALLTLSMRKTASFRFPHVFLYPVAVWVLFAATVLASYYRIAKGTVRWRDREIRI